MNHRSPIHRAALPLGAGLIALLTATAPAYEVVAASFGGCGVSGSASYTTVGTSHPGAARPIGSDTVLCCPGPLAGAFRPLITGVPKAHLVKTSPGVLTLMAVPDAPGWFWEQSSDLSSWSPIPAPQENPQLIPTDQPRRFFLLQQP